MHVHSVIALLMISLVVITAGCTSQTPPATNTTNPPPAAPTTIDVAITDGGFSPAQISIRAGDTVRWTNRATRPVWPASDDHPTHLKLPGFDARRGLSQDETYQFTFTQAGSWSYHDHLNPGMTGTVVVQ